MRSVGYANLKDVVTHWGADPNGFGGYTYDAPRILKGRWEDRQLTFIDGEGEEGTSISIIYLNDDVETGDYIFLGDATNVVDPSTIKAWRVRQFNKFRDLRGTRISRIAFL